jgi:hypothetical protein
MARAKKHYGNNLHDDKWTRSIVVGSRGFTEDLKSTLLKGRAPATTEKLKKSFDQYLSDLIRGKGLSKVRIVLE